MLKRPWPRFTMMRINSPPSTEIGIIHVRCYGLFQTAVFVTSKIGGSRTLRSLNIKPYQIAMNPSVGPVKWTAIIRVFGKGAQFYPRLRFEVGRVQFV